MAAAGDEVGFKLSGVNCNSKRPHYFGESGSFILPVSPMFKAFLEFSRFRLLPLFIPFSCILNLAFVQIWHTVIALRHPVLVRMYFSSSCQNGGSEEWESVTSALYFLLQRNTDTNS